MITTPLLLLDLLLTAGLPWPTILYTLVIDEIMIITGLVGALVVSDYKVDDFEKVVIPWTNAWTVGLLYLWLRCSLRHRVDPYMDCTQARIGARRRRFQSVPNDRCAHHFLVVLVPDRLGHL